MDNIDKPKVIVIGANVAGMNLVQQLINTEKPFDITCITREPIYDYSTCGLPYVLEGVVPNFEDIILHKPEFFYEKNVELLINTEVKSIDLKKNEIIINPFNGKSNSKTTTLQYDFLVIATGRLPIIPPIQGINLKGVHTLMNYLEGIELYNAMEGKNHAVIIGGGVIGLEVAVALNVNHIATRVVEIAPNVLPALLDPDMAKLVSNWLIEKGIQILLDKKVTSINGTDLVSSVTLSDGSEIPADIVVLSTGIRPNNELAKLAKLDIGEFNGILTDRSQHVLSNGESLNNVFALGDCVESNNLITGKSSISALASTAHLQARVVAENIQGRHSELLGVLSPTVTMLSGLQVGCVGLNSKMADNLGLIYNSATAFGKSRSRYYPGWKNIYFKFLASNGKLIGAQVIGEEDVKERINYFSLSIREGIDIKELLDMERCYTPPLALLNDPANKAFKQLI